MWRGIQRSWHSLESLWNASKRHKNTCYTYNKKGKPITFYYFPLILNYSVRSLYFHTNSYSNVMGYLWFFAVWPPNLSQPKLFPGNSSLATYLPFVQRKRLWDIGIHWNCTKHIKSAYTVVGWNLEVPMFCPKVHLLANEVRDMSVGFCLEIFLAICTCEEACESVWPLNASLYASSTCVHLRLLAGPFG